MNIVSNLGETVYVEDPPYTMTPDEYLIWFYSSTFEKTLSYALYVNRVRTRRFSPDVADEGVRRSLAKLHKKNISMHIFADTL